jgi:hypothetical protein
MFMRVTAVFQKVCSKVCKDIICISTSLFSLHLQHFKANTIEPLTYDFSLTNKGGTMAKRLAKGVKQADHPLAIAARNKVATIIDAIPPADLVSAIKRAPSLRGMILGYIAEEMFQHHVLGDAIFSDVNKHDDHDRTANKADRDFLYQGHRISVQLKSVQTNTIAWRTDLNAMFANVQNDGSDKRDVHLPNGEVVSTTNYKIGDYDILAVPLFPFTGTWDFAYMLNSECRKTTSPKYTAIQQSFLLSTMEEITYPLTGPWSTDLPATIERLIKHKTEENL